MTAERWMKMLGMGVLATGLGTSLVWLGSPAIVQAQVQAVEKPKPPTEAKKPTDEKPEQKVKIAVVAKRLEMIYDHMQRLELELKSIKDRQLDESTLSDFTLRKLIEETEMKILGLTADERKLDELIKMARQQTKTEPQYIKLIEEDKFDEIKFIRLMRTEGGVLSEWAKLSSSSSFPSESVIKPLIEKHARLVQNKRGLEGLMKSNVSDQNKDNPTTQPMIKQIRAKQDEEEIKYKSALKESSKPGAIELVKLADESVKKVQDALKEKSDSKKALTTQRKEYLRALAKLTDNTETIKIQHQLDILRDQQALLSRVLLRLELEAQGITITPEDLPAKKEK